jgi:hypothetical protein
MQILAIGIEHTLNAAVSARMTPMRAFMVPIRIAMWPPN